MKYLLLAVAVSACGGSSSYQHVRIAQLGFDIPGEWHAQDTTWRGLVTSTWTPEDNDAKESLVVMRSERSPVVATAGAATIQRLLVAAQPPGARMSPLKPVVTAHGFAGTRVDLDFTPAGLRERYHRVHIVLVDGESLVHVLYTARRPDEAQRTLNIILASIREEDAS